VANAERDKLEFESLPEFVREPYSSGRESYATQPAPSKTFIPKEPQSVLTAAELPKAAELEALWPGVSHDYFQPARRRPGFSFGSGFLAGLLVTAAGFAGFNLIAHGVTGGVSGSPGQKVVMAPGSEAQAKKDAPPSGASQVVNGQEVVAPAFPTYEVKTGDTLASIALKAYKRATPRLLDEICKANGMRNANVLSLGQKILLPEYQPQTSQVAAGNSGAAL